MDRLCFLFFSVQRIDSFFVSWWYHDMVKVITLRCHAWHTLQKNPNHRVRYDVPINICCPMGSPTHLSKTPSFYHFEMVLTRAARQGAPRANSLHTLCKYGLDTIIRRRTNQWMEQTEWMTIQGWWDHNCCLCLRVLFEHAMQSPPHIGVSARVGYARSNLVVVDSRYDITQSMRNRDMFIHPHCIK